MSRSATVTIRLPQDVKDQLETLAAQTRRSRSYLAGEAVAEFVRREMEIVAGVEQGLADVEAGRLIDHDEAMDRLDAAIAEVAAQKP